MSPSFYCGFMWVNTGSVGPLVYIQQATCKWIRSRIRRLDGEVLRISIIVIIVIVKIQMLYLYIGEDNTNDREKATVTNVLSMCHIELPKKIC